ncbi:zinc-binding alcohol dehydrogenase family protein [Zophobihabitans entericus]|uniref:Zinc-type alcohol dehydrogenase-like protein n=1 Tax=Zophobihabitans entericus TaxID=1635327 RepID=A0A6G9IC39_9GAMM|nr:zinc-binding alcohol dehydrogenase family protein [Zophobihabitans entericus]QIQ21389.1 zinc-binding alcohol dehydrogenase family protein [Zophobihabitans entericus]
MKTIGFSQSLPISEANSLVELDLPKPEYGAKDLLVEVKAISVNPVDIKIRRSALPEKGQHRILGWDAVGIVQAMGSEVTGFKVGDEVYYAGVINRPGSNQQYQAVDFRIVALKPKSLTDTQAAAIPLTALTAWEALFDRLRVDHKVSGAANAILIIGGAGGVGSIMIQLARQLTDLTIIATASRSESQEWVKKMGAHHVIDHTKPLAKQVAELNIGQPAFVFSTSHTDRYLPEIVELIAPQGRISLIDDPEALNVLLLKRKSLSIHWEFMYTRPLFNTADIAEQHNILTKVAKLLDDKKLITTMTQELSPISAENLKKAHAQIESGRTIGKLVLSNW